MSEVNHEPVLLAKVVSLLEIKEGQTVLDGTLGAGGYAQAILERIGTKGRLIALDRDQKAIQSCQERLGKSSNIAFCHVNYSSFEEALQSQGISACDRMVLDLGLSRKQLLDPSRGFSFSESGPLDMRMDSEEAVPTAFDLVNTMPEKELADLIYKWGQEHYSRRIARKICDVRKKGPIRTSGELAEIIQKTIPKTSRIHPATRTFQAFRMAVNGEMEHLETFLEKFPSYLNRKGRLGIVSFHSLEDRAIKMRFRELSQTGEFKLVNKKVEKPDFEEVKRNPASRSAKLRVIERN